MRSVAMADRTLQDASACRFATLTGEWTTMNSATPRYGRYCMCCNKPTETCVCTYPSAKCDPLH